MAQSSVPVTSGAGNTIDTWTTATNAQKRQGVVIADPSVDVAVAGVVSADPGPSSTAYGQIVRLAGSAQVQIAGSTGSLAVYFDRGNPAMNLTSGTLTSITNTVGIYFDRGNPSVTIGGATSSVGIYFDRANPAVNLTSGTLTSITNTVGIYFDRANPSVNVGTPTVAAITATVGVYFDRANPSVNIGTPTIAAITNTVGVYFDRATPAMNVAQYGGNAAITPNNGIPVINTSATMAIFTTSGSYTGNGTAGLTLVSPSANYSFKVFAFSLSTTAQTNTFGRFTNGASSTPTEYWRVALQAPSQGISGANLAVTPPGYLWATGTSTTLSLVLDNVTLVHYSVSYVKETS